MTTTTYAYGGEFSSDDDYEREQAEQQAKWRQIDAQGRPSLEEVEGTIEQIKNLEPEEDFPLTDELLAGLLDYFKTKRGPIVDSTRKLYKKIVFRVIRGETNNGNFAKDERINDRNNNSNNDDASSNWNMKQASNDIPSSDEDEPMPPVPTQGSSEFRMKLNRLVLDNVGDNPEPMDVDSEPFNGQIRSTKQVDLSSTEEEDNVDDADEDDDDDEDNDDGNGNDDSAYSGLDVTESTPKQASQQSVSAPKPLMASTPINRTSQMRKLTQSENKNNTMAETSVTKRKPYTRSQRASARVDAENAKVSSNSGNTQPSNLVNLDTGKPTVTARSSRIKYFVMIAFVMALIAFFIYYFRSQNIDGARLVKDRLLSIKF